jgi:DNA-binding GntR family transcriptional regulator
MTLSNYIRDDLKSHIKSGNDLPCELTLAGIAEYYGVSPTPVRVAVNGLIAENYLQKEHNGRLSIDQAKLPDNDEPIAVTKPLPPSDRGEMIARDVMLRSLRGDAGFLREEETAGRYGVSRTVIRQVFSQLAGKGLMEHLPRLGWRVRRFHEADMCAYLEIREVLELKALDLARPYLDRLDMESMLAGNPIPQPGSGFQLDNRIHAYLVEKAANFYLRDFFDRHGVYYMMLFEHAALEVQVVAEMAGQHREILHALIEQEWDGARRALVHHIRAQRPVMQKLIMSAGSQSAPHIGITTE